MYECSICHDPLESTDTTEETSELSIPLHRPFFRRPMPRIVVTFCGHMFHGPCLNDWFINKESASCPICRTNSFRLRRVYPAISTSSEDPQPSTSSSIGEVQDCPKCNSLRGEIGLLMSVNELSKALSTRVVQASNTAISTRLNGRHAALVVHNKKLFKDSVDLRRQILKLDYETQSFRNEIQQFNNKNQILHKENTLERSEIQAKGHENEFLRLENQKLHEENENLRLCLQVNREQSLRNEMNEIQKISKTRKFWRRVKATTVRTFFRCFRGE